MFRKGKRSLVVLSCDMLLLLVTFQKLARDSRCSAVMSMNTLHCHNRIQGSLLTFYSMQGFCNFSHWKSGLYDGLTRVLQTSVPFIMQYEESRFAMSLPVIGRVIDTRKPLMEGGRGGFPESSFSLEGFHFHTSNKYLKLHAYLAVTG